MFKDTTDPQGCRRTVTRYGSTSGQALQLIVTQTLAAAGAGAIGDTSVVTKQTKRIAQKTTCPITPQSIYKKKRYISFPYVFTREIIFLLLASFSIYKVPRNNLSI